MTLETLKTNNRKANKVHRCDLCLCDIKKGVTYENQTNKYDSHIYTFKMHLECRDLCNDLDIYDEAAEGVTSDNFCDTVEDEYRNRINRDFDCFDESKTTNQLVNELRAKLRE